MSWPWKWSRGKNPPKADLGKDLSMYWSEELKRWVEPGKEEECRKEAAATAAPPKNGPASMPASYTLERTSLQSRYVETPLFSNPNGARKETPGPAVRNLVPKADGKPLGANIFVPATPVREAEAGHEAGAGGGLSNGVSGELGDLPHDCNGDGEPDEAKSLLKSRRSLSAGDVPQGLQNEGLGETNKSSSLASTDTIDGERANSVEDGPMQGAEITSCRDCEDLEGDGKIPIPALSNGNEEDEFRGKLPFPDAETAWNSGDALDLMEGYNMEGGSRYDKVNEGETEVPNNAMLVEESKDFFQNLSANQKTGEVAEDISKIFDGWTEEERQRWIDWLDENYTREYWSKWSGDEWNEFWQWYQQANCGSYEQQDGHTSPTDLSATDTWTMSTAAVEEEISVQNFESSQVLSQLAVSQGEDSRSQQGGGEKPQDSGIVFEPTEKNSDNQQFIGSERAISGADETTGKGLSLSGQAEPLDGSPNLTSPKSWQEGSSVDKHNIATDVIHTPLVTTSCGTGVSGVDGQILKKKSKLTGPLPWDFNVDEDDDALDAGTELGGLQSPSTATAGQPKQEPLIVTKADTATTGEAQPSLHSKHTGQDISLSGVGFGNMHGLGSAGEQDAVDTKDDKHQGLLEENPVEKTYAHKGAAGIVEVSGRSADRLCILTEIENNDAESSVDKIQEAEKINGKIVTRVPARNGLNKGIELNGIDLGAMLLELQVLLQYVESPDEGVFRRKETTEKQLADVIGALRPGEPGFNNSEARKDDSPASDSFEEPAEVKLTATHGTEVGKLVEELSCMQDDMDDMALALGLESRKVNVLRQHCKKQGIDADTILKGVEDSFGVPSNDASEHEDFEPTSTTDPVTFADSTSPVSQQILDSLGCAEDDVLLEPGSKQLLNMSSSGYPSWHVDGVV